MVQATSKAALAAINQTAATVEQQTLAAYDLAGTDGLTADEAADLTGIDRLTVRPRVSILFSQGLLQDSGDRRPNASGRKAIVWIKA